MEKPLEAWLPLIDPMLVHQDTHEDLRLALEVVDIETTVWVLPSLDEARRWSCPFNPIWRHVAIPGRRSNRFDLLYIGGDGSLLQNPHALFRRTVSKDADELLDAWLALEIANPDWPEELLVEDSGLSGVLVPDFGTDPPGFKWEILVATPHPPQALASGRRPIPMDPNGILQQILTGGVDQTVDEPGSTESGEGAGQDKERKEIEAIWRRTSEDISAGPLHDLGEYDDRFRRYEGFDETETLIQLHTEKWPDPLRFLFFYGGGLQAFAMQRATRQVASLSSESREHSLQWAWNACTGYVVPGLGPAVHTELLPRALRHGEEGFLMEVEGRYGLVASDLLELFRMPEGLEIFRQRRPVTRCLGVGAMFLALLIDRLEQGWTVRTCASCGRLIHGHGNKRYCSRDHNLDCWRQRARQRQRRSRSSRSARS